jgi:hypothetical protein
VEDELILTRIYVDLHDIPLKFEWESVEKIEEELKNLPD